LKISRMRGWLLVLGGLFLVIFLVPKPPLLDGLGYSSEFLDRDGRLLRLEVAADERYRIFMPLDRISPLLVEATLLHEDRYYYDHPGANPVALAKALENECRGNARRIGASTITMQVARLRFHLHTRTWTGKLLQIALGLQLELHYSKRQILEAYFNLAPYGRNIEGIGAASRIYYDKAPDQLTLDEAVTLAAIPQSPARRAPRYPNDPAPDLVRARQIVFAQWVQVHPQDADRGGGLAFPPQIRVREELPFLAPHFVNGIKTSGGGGPIETTLDLGLQQILESRIAADVAANRERGVQNAAAILVDYTSMEVVAAVGSADYFSRRIDGEVDGLSMRRSPGSALKPFVYALALQDGLIQPHSLLKDVPTGFAGYDPENFDKDFVGPIQAGEALRQSRNVPAVSLLARLGTGPFYKLLQDTGVEGLEPESHYGLTLALGSEDVSLREVARLYALLANHGLDRPLRDLRAAPPTAPVRRLSPEASFLVLDMLKDAPRPGALNTTGWGEAPAPVAWKTGTSWAFRDAWTAAVFDRYVLVVWVGNFNGAGNAAFVGRETAAPLLFSMVDAIRGSGNRPEAAAAPAPAPWESTEGLNLRQVDLCALSGELATPQCPQTIKGWFIPGVSPITPCPIHREIAVDTRNGLRATPETPPAAIKKEVYEVWPSDLLALFRAAGMPRRLPPAFPQAVDAPSEVPSTEAGAPEIRSPKAGIVYTVARTAADASNSAGISLEAITAGGGEEAYWFANADFLGRAKAGEPLFWKPHPGTYHLSVVDEKGLSASQEVTVEAMP